MEINGIQLVFILIALAEWIFLDAQEVHRGSLSDGWLFPNNLESVKFASILCVLLAFYPVSYTHLTLPTNSRV